MVVIVTGEIGEGKSSRIFELIRKLRYNFIEVGGICSPGFWKHGKRDYYHVVDLENGHSALLCDHNDSGKDIPFPRYFFKSEGIDFGLRALIKTRCTHPDVLIVDEVGGLEWEGKGWFPFLNAIDLSMYRVVIVVARKKFAGEISKRFHFGESVLCDVRVWSSDQLFNMIMDELKKGNERPALSLTGIILAGGKSSRFGKDKGLVSFRCKSLIERAIERFQPLCNHIMISSNNPEHQRFGIKVIHDAQPDCGPMMGLYSCLKASADPVNFVVSVDTPLVPKGLFNEMLKVIGPAQVMVPYHGNEKYEPVIGVYRRDVLEYMERLFAQGLYRLPDLFKQVRFEGYRVGDGQPFSNSGYFYNINTQDDLTLLENRQ